MRTSESTKALLPALFAARAVIAILPLIKDKQGDKAKYLQLPTLLSAVEPILFENGLFLVQGCGDNVITDGVLCALSIDTRIYHAASGEWIENQVLIPVAGQMKSKNDGGGLLPVIAQSAGVSITYGRRYGIFSILSISVDEDTDGAEKRATRSARARKTAVGVVEVVAAKTNERTGAMKDALAKMPAIVRNPDGCSDCGSKLGARHNKDCPNAFPKAATNGEG